MIDDLLPRPPATRRLGDAEPATGRAGPLLLAACLVLGTLVRFWFGARQHGWLLAPDQLAWGMLLSEAADGPLRFDQLLHYPHEGATPLLSVLALGLAWLPAVLPPLSWAALVVDTAARGVQIVVVDRVFGRRAAVAFGVWTVAAVPGLLPWGTVNFAVHALSSFWPFVLLWAAARYDGSTRDAVLLGALLGLAIAWAYDSLVLVPVVLAWAWLAAPQRTRGRATALAVGAAAVAVIPHAVMRAVVDYGFHLGAMRGFVRGAALDWPGAVELAGRVAATFGKTLAGASLLPAFGPVPLAAVRFGWLVLCAAGIVLALRAGGRRAPDRRAVAFGAAVVVSYLLAYAASPFFAGSGGHSGFMYYRHLPYILPVFVALALRGLVAARGALPAVALVVVSAIGGGSALADAGPPDRPLYAATGWILAQKLGHDPDRLGRLLERAPAEARPELAEGYGAGLAAALLPGVTNPNHPAVDRVARLIDRLPASARAHARTGAAGAFGPGVTPPLEPALRPRLEALLGLR